MPAPRMQTFGDSAAAKPVIAQSIDYAEDALEAAHVHHRAQLVYASSGIVRVMTPLGLWMLTPGNALLIGSQVEHELQMVGRVSMRTLYILPDVLTRPVGGCRAIAVDEMLRASIVYLCNAGSDADGESRAALIVPLILRLLADAEDGSQPACLPMPATGRLRGLCESLIAQPANTDTLERWAERVGASSRTVARLFRLETGMSFSQWREQLRLAEAISRLSVGEAAARVAGDLGYADLRTFTVMFRRVLGTTPQQFAQRTHDSGPRSAGVIQRMGSPAGAN